MMGVNRKASNQKQSKLSHETDYSCQCVSRAQCYSQFLTFPSTVSRSVTPLKVAELQLCEERLLLTVRSRSASGVVTVLARPSTAAFSSCSFLMISSCRASRALTAGSTSPFWEDERQKCSDWLKWEFDSVEHFTA